MDQQENFEIGRRDTRTVRSRNDSLQFTCNVGRIAVAQAGYLQR
jgi:hypothetical protein